MKILAGTQAVSKSHKRKKAPELVAEREEEDRGKSDVSNESSESSDEAEQESSSEDEEDLLIAALEELAEEEVDGAQGELAQPSTDPSPQLSAAPSSQPSAGPSPQLSVEPSSQPSADPSSLPSAEPSSHASAEPSSLPSAEPSSLLTEATTEVTEEMHADYFRAQNHSIRTRKNTSENPWLKMSDLDWGIDLSEDVNWEFQWGTAMEERDEKYLQYEGEDNVTECTEQRTYYSSLIMQNSATGAPHSHAVL